MYPDGITCRTCKEVRPHHRLTNRKAYSCDYCGTHVYLLAGTIFEKSTTPLKSWFYAMYLIGSTRCGISAKQLERELGVTYKTAWRMFKQIRTLMAEDFTMLSGEVELDETYIGGGLCARADATEPESSRLTKSRRAAMNRMRNKSVVAGQVQRGGRLQAKHLPNGTAGTLVPLARTFVIRSPSSTPTSFAPTAQLDGEDTRHKRVNHSAKVYVSGRRAREHAGRVLVAPEERDTGRLPLGQRQVPSVLRQRVHVPLQPPEG